MAYTAVLDANVLVPARVRDALLTLAEADLYHPVWSADILDETVRHLPDHMPDAARRHLVGVMSSAFPEACITWPDGYTFTALEQVNEKDRHVLKAAAAAGADVVVTEDAALRTEWERQSAPLSTIDLQGCAEFTAYAVDTDLPVACEALDLMVRQRWAPEERDPWPRLIAWIRQQGWAMTADLLERR